MCPAWLLAAVLVVGVARGAVGQCWEHLSCREPNSESSIKECIQLCRSDLTAETPVVPGNAHLQPPAPSDPSSSSSSSSSSSPPQAKRSYSMEHFRWGKPVGRKRRPVKVYTSNGVEDESAEAFPRDMRRRAEQEVMKEEEEEEGPYEMKHLRWKVPTGSKRYGGFMKSQRPLVTLFKNVINKHAQQHK
ncbi:pro-opiomelanocortin-like [Perca flavescens]|uniref:pro-opiomelanocortin-like n=1 Tax=Perca flavescens TaxID=8167 RepID=UPI00106E7977|nr:pro-opiomelanocortin-like [Perca flavescens]